MNRKSKCLFSGRPSEAKFLQWLEANGITAENLINTGQDVKTKTDFVVNGKRIQVKAPSRNQLAPGDLTIEHRAVDGSVGWLYKVDYVIKFCSDRFFLKIPTGSLRDAVSLHLPAPPELAPRGKAKAMSGWYARPDWYGRSRKLECCYVVSKDWLLENTLAGVIDTECSTPLNF